LKILLSSVRIKLQLLAFAVLVALDLFLLRIPLTATLGYEFSAVNGLVLYLFCGFLFMNKIKNEHAAAAFIESMGKIRFSLLVFVAIPFIIGIFNTLILTKCPLTAGIQFYLLITVPAALLGTVMAYYSIFLSRKYCYLIFVSFFVILAFLPVVEIYIYPQVFFFNPIIGFFPGTVYDEDLSIDSRLILYRLINVCFMALVIFLVDNRRNKKILYKFTVSILLFLIAVSFFLLKPVLHFATNKSRLEEVLKNRIGTPHFDIHYSDSSISEKQREYTGLIHEYYFELIDDQLAEHYKKRISTYLFYDGARKMELIGAGNANLAKPWLNQAYLNISSYEGTLKHELVHVMASDFGGSPFKVASNLNSAIIEGLAMAIENNFDGFPLHFLAKNAYESGYRIPISQLFSGLNFFAQSSSLSYVYAGSFIKYLIDRYGIEKIKLLYKESNFNKYFGKSVSQLEDDYKRFLETKEIKYNRYQAQLYFSGLTIFQKFCPRIVAERQKKADAMLKAGKISEAESLYHAIYLYSNSFRSLVGYIGCLSKEKKNRLAAEYLNGEMVKFTSSQYYFYLELTRGDLLIENGSKTDAVITFDSLLSQNPHIDYRNGVLLREAIINDGGADSLKSYFKKSADQKLGKLMKMNDRQIKYFTIPFLIDLAEKTNTDLDRFFLKRKNLLRCSDFMTEDALIKISKYFLRKLDCASAQFFALEAVRGPLDEDFKHEATDNLKMVNWFKNSVEETGRTFSY